jgi:salicylate hydroxylase
MITPNGTRVLSQLGFSFSNARAVKIESWSTLHGDTMEPIARVDLTGAEKIFGFPAWAVHRVSLHNELLRLATSATETGTPIKIHLASEVTEALPKEGSITLQNGAKHVADLVVAADGLHSVLKRVTLEGETTAPSSTGLSAFRFLIDTEILGTDESLSETLKKKGPGATLLADTKDIINERHIMWYPCEE